MSNHPFKRAAWQTLECAARLCDQQDCAPGCVRSVDVVVVLGQVVVLGVGEIDQRLMNAKRALKGFNSI
jgi:hypothetical protein